MDNLEGQELLYPHLFVLDNTGVLQDYTLNRSLSVGRKRDGSTVDIQLQSAIVSRKHGTFALTDNGVEYYDTQSANGTMINGRCYGIGSGEFKKILEDGDVLRVENPANQNGTDTVVMIYKTQLQPKCDWRYVTLNAQYHSVTIGRKVESNVISLKDIRCSRQHAALKRTAEGWTLCDCNSGNGVFYNGRRLATQVSLQNKDCFRIVDYLFLFINGCLLYFAEQDAKPQMESNETISNMEAPIRPFMNQSKGAYRGKNLEIDIDARTARAGLKTLTLLRNIHITVKSGEMVLILGGSGAGKTTFMNAVMGYEKAKGSIRYGDMDIYSEYEKMKYEIGFVPQDILLRENDSVYDTLYNSAQMKLPNSPEIWKERVEKVLEMVSLTHVKDSLVKSVSGGEKKRVSAGVELIADPSLFFLDEPDSGLDAYSATELMENLRKIANMGKIVMVISHSPDRAAELFDKVVILAKSREDNSGHLAFFGTVEETKAYFGADSLEGVVGRINNRDADIEGYIRTWENMKRRC